MKVDLQFEWDEKIWEAIVVLNESTFLFLEVDPRYPGFRWTVSAWTGSPNDEEWDDCWFSNCYSETNVCDTLEEAQECAENFVIRFRESLAKEADLRREWLAQWLAQELAAIDRLRNILEERESNAQ